jgi:hypothetical protein
MYYDHQQPFVSKIKFFHGFTPGSPVRKPKAYIIPQGWYAVIHLLKQNQVSVSQLKKDSSFTVTAYRIEDYKPNPRPYEKHHKNSGVVVSDAVKTIGFLKGDYLVYMDQPANRYILEMLEPTGDDSFFSWNFFDAILQQKEGYSDYRWEDIAAEVLKKDTGLQQKLAEKKASDPKFAADSHAILDFIYKNSPFYEKAHLAYPVYRIEY